MDFVDTRKDLKVADVKIRACAYSCQDGLPHARGAMDRKSHADQVLNDVLDLLLVRRLLHCDDHSGRLAVNRGASNNARLRKPNSLIIDLRIHFCIAQVLGRLGRDFFLLDLPHHVHDALVNTQQVRVW